MKKVISFIMALVVTFGVVSASVFASAKEASPWSYSDTPTRALYYTSPVMTGNDVKWMQQALNITVSADLDVDGSFGPASQKAVKKFQKKYKLEQDGSFGPASRKKMVSVLKDKGYSEPKFSSAKYSKLATYYIGDSKYYKAKIKKETNGVAKNTIVYLTSNYKVVTNEKTLSKLIFTDCVNYGKDQWVSISNNYNAVKELNKACKKILSAEFKQKILGSASTSLITSIMISNPKTFIDSCKYLSEEGYIALVTGVLLEEVTKVALSNTQAIKNYCSDGVDSYEEACKVKKALVNAKTAFDFAGTKCMLGLADDYSSTSKAFEKAINNHLESMFNTLVETYGNKIGKVVDLCSNGENAIKSLKNLYRYDKCLSGAKKTYNSLIDDTVDEALEKVIKTQMKLK